MTKVFDLVLFDLGGVIGEIDGSAFAAAALNAGVDPRPALTFWQNDYDAGGDDDHPLHRAERGEISLNEFLDLADSVAPARPFFSIRQAPAI